VEWEFFVRINGDIIAVLNPKMVELLPKLKENFLSQFKKPGGLGAFFGRKEILRIFFFFAVTMECGMDEFFLGMWNAVAN
jgi:hypothetical protein